MGDYASWHSPTWNRPMKTLYRSCVTFHTMQHVSWHCDGVTSQRDIFLWLFLSNNALWNYQLSLSTFEWFIWGDLSRDFSWLPIGAFVIASPAFPASKLPPENIPRNIQMSKVISVHLQNQRKVVHFHIKFDSIICPYNKFVRLESIPFQVKSAKRQNN